MAKSRGLFWLVTAALIYIGAFAMVVGLTYTRGLLPDKSFWDGVTGNLMASFIEAFIISVIAGGALYARDRKRWGYARSLACVRLVNGISVGWDAVVGVDGDSQSTQRRVVYHFEGLRTNFGPDFQALTSPSAFWKRGEINQRRALRRKYDAHGVDNELSALSGTLANVIETLENTLALLGNHCSPELWSTALLIIEELKQYRVSLSSPGEFVVSKSIQTDVILDALARTGFLITDKVPRESLDAFQDRVSAEANDAMEKLERKVADKKK